MTTPAEHARTDPATLCERIIAAEEVVAELHHKLDELQRAYARLDDDDLVTDDDTPHVAPVIALKNARHGIADTFAALDVVAYGLEKARRSASRLRQKP